MHSSWSRRSFLSTSVAGGLASLSGTHLIAGLRPVTDEQVRAAGGVVQLRPEIEPLVKLIEDTPRQKLMEEIGSRIRKGLSYHDVLAALFLAGVRNVQPRPAVGFKFHAVLVVNSAHIASLASPDSDRWLPILWALDEFKSAQARDVSEGNWTMGPVDESGVPSPGQVRELFHKSMQRWDESAADVAAAGVARCLGATEVLELYAQYAARDFRSIGHKAIFLANSWRTLQTIGWQHAEPVLRSLSYAFLNHNGEPNPADNDLAPDRPWRANQELIGQVRDGWMIGRVDESATAELLEVIRTGSANDAAKSVVELLNKEVSPQSIFDALHLASGEMLMQQTGIVALHSVTTTNAIRFLFDQTGVPETRLLLLLQNASFLPLFREAMVARGTVGDARIDQLQATAPPAEGSEAIESICRAIRKQNRDAAQSVLGYLAAGRDVKELMNATRRLVFLKGNDSHDYKFSSAALEDFYKISPAWRDRYLASSVYYLRGSGDPDNGLVARIRAALG